jgi:hypothetical protein
MSVKLAGIDLEKLTKKFHGSCASTSIWLLVLDVRWSVQICYFCSVWVFAGYLLPLLQISVLNIYVLLCVGFSLLILGEAFIICQIEFT